MNSLQGNNSRVDENENQINGVEHKEEEKFNQNGKKKNKDRVRSLWNNFKFTNFESQGFQKEKRKRKKLKTCLKI